MSTDLNDLKEYLTQKLSGTLRDASIVRDELNLYVSREKVRPCIQFLRDDERCKFEVLIDLCAVDYPKREERFDVVYHLLSPRLNQRVRVKITTTETHPLDSIVEIFEAANWFEREAYDMYGILFTGHPDLRRILTDYGFEGFPLRKDFPLTGYVEVRYDDEQKRVIYEPVKLNQEYRTFDFESPWESLDTSSQRSGDEKASLNSKT